MGVWQKVRRPLSPDLSVLPTANGELLVGRPPGLSFLETADAAVRRWRYEKPRRAPISFFVRLSFAPQEATAIVWHHAARPPLPKTELAARVAATPPLPPDCPVRVGGTVQTPRKTRHVPPIYPSVAQSAKAGRHYPRTTIGADGKVGNVRVLR